MKLERYEQLGFEEAERLEKILDDCIKHFIHAREKHPFFCRYVEGKGGIDWNYTAILIKDKIAQDPSLVNVLESEKGEFFSEAIRGNTERAHYEACDLIAVVLRYLMGDMEFYPDCKKEVK